VQTQTPIPLVAAYFERRQALKRFFLARGRSDEEADDLVQDLYLKLLGVEHDEVIREPGAYLYRIAANMMLDRMRQRRRAAARDGDWRLVHHVASAGEDVADAPGADVVVAARQQLRRVEAALSALPERAQRAFRLHKFEGLSHAEVAGRLGISRSAVEKHMMSALKHLLATVGR
jgi:RNA polymerase sigma factor (sigma-70 family)